MRGHLRSTTCAFAIALSLAACGGGSGGSESSSILSSPTGNPTSGISAITLPAPASDPAAYQAEREASWAYGLVGGESLYNSGARGQNTKIALIDSGVSDSGSGGGLSSVDYNGNLDPLSIDIENGEIRLTGNLLDGLDRGSHGNAIASIMVSRRDGRKLIGIAPEATLLSIDADQTVGEGIFTEEDVAFGIRYAADSDADVINLSLGGAREFPDVYEAIAYAVDKGSVFVTSAGNDDQNNRLTYPAIYAGLDTMQGRLLAVGSVSEDKTISYFSSRPENMIQAQYFLVAPGEDVPGTLWHGINSTFDGTSFAAPFVTGAIAALKSKYPYMAPEEIVQLVLRTAEDLGAPGVDLVYGHGLLDLEAAVQPVGSTSLASANGESFDLASTELYLGSAFGDALADSVIVGKALGLDEFGRGFSNQLSAKIDRAAFPAFLEQRLSNERPEIQQAGRELFGGAFSLAAEAEANGTDYASYLDAQSADTDPVLRWRSEETMIGSVSAGLHLSAEQSLFGAQENSGLFLGHSDMINPVASLADTGRSIKVDNDTIGFAFHQADSSATEGESTTFQTRIRPANGLSITHSLVIEDSAGMGSSGDGAFGGFGSGATSNFLGLSAGIPVDGWQIGGDATFGITEMGGDDAVLSNWSTVTSSAFSLHATRRGILTDNDRFGLLFGQPLRVESGRVDATLPVEQQDDGSLVYQTQSLGLTPSGRELRLEMVYERQLSKQMSISPFMLLRHEPGHIETADDEAIGGLRATMRW